MKSIIFIRHAQSVPQDHTIPSDHARPLSYIGRQQCQLMSTKLQEHWSQIDHWFVSDAERTMETFNLFDKEWPEPTSSSLHHRLYLPSFSELEKFIKKRDDRLNHIAIVCHNPSVSSFALQFAKGFYTNISTAGVYRITFNTTQWQSIHPDNSKLDFYIYPKLYV